MMRDHDDNDAGTDRYWIRVASRAPLTNRLFCFPYAGGSPASFMKLVPLLHPGTELLLLQLPDVEDEPGRALALMPLLDALAEKTRRIDAVPSVFFGHSLGAIMAFELARRCQTPWLKGLILSGCVAPSHWPTARSQRLSTLNDDDFILALQDYQGMPAALLDDAELMRFFLPVLRAHFHLIASYRYQPDANLSLPFAVLAGANDSTVVWQQLLEWKHETRGAISYEAFPGHHFFFENHLAQIVDLAYRMTTRHAAGIELTDTRGIFQI